MNVPVTIFFVFAVMTVTRRIERRFSEEPLPAIIAMVFVSVALAGLFVMFGEFWTSLSSR